MPFSFSCNSFFHHLTQRPRVSPGDRWELVSLRWPGLPVLDRGVVWETRGVETQGGPSGWTAKGVFFLFQVEKGF